MEAFTEVLLVYGPLGVLAAIGLFWKHQADKRREAQDVLRDKREETQAAARDKREEAQTLALQALVKEAGAAVRQLATEFAGKLQERETAHRDEVEKLMDRFVTLVERYGEHYRQLLDKVSTTLESLARAAHK
jgi:hypothetical protein